MVPPRARPAGFTLLELVVVLIIAGVLAVSLLPRFFSGAGVSEYTLRDQALSLLRQVQIQAMQCTDCIAPQLQLSSYSLLANGSSCAVADSQALCLAPGGHIQFSAPFSSLSFDSLGRPLLCTAPCQLTISGEVALPLCIESEGYIHPC